MNFNKLSKIYAKFYYQELAPLSSRNIIFSLFASLYNVWHELVFYNAETLSFQVDAVIRTLGAAGHLNWTYTPTTCNSFSAFDVSDSFQGGVLLGKLLKAYEGDCAQISEVDKLYSRFLDHHLCGVLFLQKALLSRSRTITDDAIRTQLQKELKR